MAGEKHRRVASELLARFPDVEPGPERAPTATPEELLGAAPAWVARIGPKGHVCFVGRHRALVALTDRRLLAWRRPKRNPAPMIDVAVSALHPRVEHATRPFVQLLAQVDTDHGRETLVLELRHRDRAFARALGRAMGHGAAAAGVTAAPPAPR